MSLISGKTAKVRILDLLINNPSKAFTYGDIAEELELSKTNIGKLINPMAKEGKLLVKKIGNQKIVKSKASSSSDQRSSSIHSSSIEKDNDVDLTEDRDFDLDAESSSSDHCSSGSGIHSSSTEKENNVDLTEDRDFDLGAESSSSDQRSSSIHSSSIEKEKIMVPEHIKIAWKDLGPSIASAFSKRKWPTKHKMFTIFDNWINELLKG